jgi:transposase
VINKRTIFDIHKLSDMGMSEREIARTLHLARPTVRKYLVDPDLSKINKSPGHSKLEPYYDYIDELLEDWPDASAVVIKQRIDEKGYVPYGI